MPEPETRPIWGVLGGAFDPVHLGHIKLAEGICAKKNLAGVLFVPSYNHPFKADTERTPYALRVEMLRLALEPHSALHTCEIEDELDLSGFTIDTIRALKERYPERAFRFIMGADNLEQLPEWHRPTELLREVRFLVGARPGYMLHVRVNDLPTDRLELVETELMDVSSSEIRSRLRRGESAEALKPVVPQAVLTFIERKKLYR